MVCVLFCVGSQAMEAHFLHMDQVSVGCHKYWYYKDNMGKMTLYFCAYRKSNVSNVHVAIDYFRPDLVIVVKQSEKKTDAICVAKEMVGTDGIAVMPDLCVAKWLGKQVKTMWMIVPFDLSVVLAIDHHLPWLHLELNISKFGLLIELIAECDQISVRNDNWIGWLCSWFDLKGSVVLGSPKSVVVETGSNGSVVVKETFKDVGERSIITDVGRTSKRYKWNCCSAMTKHHPLCHLW